MNEQIVYLLTGTNKDIFHLKFSSFFKDIYTHILFVSYTSIKLLKL